MPAMSGTSGPLTTPGAHLGPDGTTFVLRAPNATAVHVCLLAETASGSQRQVPMSRDTDSRWVVTVPGVGVGTRYGFRVDGPWEPAAGHRFNPAKLLMDPYAHAVAGEFVPDPAVFGSDSRGRPNQADSAPFVPHAVVTGADATTAGRTAATNRPGIAWQDTLIYELHVRGFTRNHPGVPTPLRGTYAGLAQPAVIEHLRSVGVTTIELLPVHAFTSEPAVLARGLSNYWGYNALAFAAPHPGYAHARDPHGQLHEFGEMVRTLHDAGLEVVLDVVFNHSSEGGADGPTLSLRGLDNATYYRLDPADPSRYVDMTGTGNTLFFGRPEVDELVLDSLRWWVEQMGVDGFRFDLAATLGRCDPVDPALVDTTRGLLAAITADPVVGAVKLIAEPWDVGPDGYQLARFPSGWAEWNDRYRDSVRDFWRGRPNASELATRISGSSDLYADDGRHPTASVNFITAHDGFTLRDLVSYEHKHNEANGEGNLDGSNDNRSSNHGVEGPTDDAHVRAARLAAVRALSGTLLLSAGVPMLVAGDEFGRTQRGNNNAYCQDNEMSWLDWRPDPDWAELADWFRVLARLRAQHPVLRRTHFLAGRTLEHGVKDLAWFGASGQEMTQAAWQEDDLHVLGAYLADEPDLLWWFNGGPAPAYVQLPALPPAPTFEQRLDSATGDASRAFDLAGPGSATYKGGDVLRLAGTSFTLLTAH